MSDDGTLKYRIEVDGKDGVRSFDDLSAAQKRFKASMAESMPDFTKDLADGLRKAAGEQAKLNEQAEHGISGLKRLAETASRVEGGFGIRLVDERAAIALEIMGAAMGGVAGAGLVLLPVIGGVAKALIEMASGEGAAKAQADQLKESMEAMASVLKGLAETMEKASALKTGNLFDSMAHDSKVIDASGSSLKSYTEHLRAMNKAQMDTKIAEINNQANLKELGTDFGKLKHPELEKEKQQIDREQKIAEVRAQYARNQANEDVESARKAAQISQEALTNNSDQQQRIRDGIERAKGGREKALDDARNAPGGRVRSDQQLQIDEEERLSGKSRALSDLARRNYVPQPGNPTDAAWATAWNKQTQLSPSEQSNLDGLKRNHKANQEAINSGNVTFDKAKEQRTNPLALDAASDAASKLKAFSEEIKSLTEEQKKLKEQSTELANKQKEAAANVSLTEEQRKSVLAGIQQEKSALDVRQKDLGEKMDSAKGKDQQEVEKAKRDERISRDDDTAKKDKENTSAFDFHFNEYAKDSKNMWDKTHTGGKDAQHWNPMQRQAQKDAAGGQLSTLQNAYNAFWTPDMVAKTKGNTPAALDMQKTMAHQKELIADAKERVGYANHDLGTDKQGHKVVSRVYDHAKKQTDSMGQMKESVDQMNAHLAGIKDALTQKLSVK